MDAVGPGQAWQRANKREEEAIEHQRTPDKMHRRQVTPTSADELYTFYNLPEVVAEAPTARGVSRLEHPFKLRYAVVVF